MRIPKGGVFFFDSGIGGLSVLAECKNRLPNATFYYYGDNARAPYGNLPRGQIERYVFEIFERFERLQPSAAVIACNTVTALCIESLRKKYPFPMIGVEPAVFSAAKSGGEIFVLATRATCESERFRSLCARAAEKYSNVLLRPFACEGLAGTIEKRWNDHDFDYSALFPQGKPDSVVLGCTHYVFIKKRIGEFYGCPTYDGNAGIANRLHNFVDNLPNPLYGLNCGEPVSVEERGTLRREKRPLPATVLLKAPVYFLGEQKEQNRYVFEQTFAKSGNKRG